EDATVRIMACTDSRTRPLPTPVSVAEPSFSRWRENGRIDTIAGVMSETEPIVMRHVIAALVTNEPGVLAQVASMFAARGFNIDSLVVGRTENPELSRMTIVVVGDNAVLEQVRKQLQKLVPVVKVVDYQGAPFVERDLMLVQVATGDADKSRRSELIELVNLF